MPAVGDQQDGAAAGMETIEIAVFRQHAAAGRPGNDGRIQMNVAQAVAMARAAGIAPGAIPQMLRGGGVPTTLPQGGFAAGVPAFFNPMRSNAQSNLAVRNLAASLQGTGYSDLVTHFPSLQSPPSRRTRSTKVRKCRR